MKSHISTIILLISVFINSAIIEAQILQVPRDTSYTSISTYLKIKKNFPDAQLVKDSLPKELKAYTDVVYSVIPDSPYGERKLKLNIYRKKDRKKYPVLLMIHGGGWSSGNKSMQIPLAQQIARHGYVTIPVEYRLLPEAPYPAAIYDIKTAIRWVRANAAKYRMDASHIAISGCSAGGQLAALAGMTNQSEIHEQKREYPQYSSDVQVIIDMDGTLTFVAESSIAETNENIRKSGGQLPKNALWLGGRYEDARRHWEEASPLLQVTRNSASICFINSLNPRYSNGRDELMARLTEYGIYSEKNQINVSLHTFWLFRPWFDEVVNISVKYLDKSFKKPRCKK